jgi:hypothetical protein
MLRKGLVFAALCLLPASFASAQVRGPWELELSGSAVNGNKFNGLSAAANVDIGYFILDQLEVGVRQSLSYTDIGVPKALDGSTRVAVDFHLPLGDQNQFVPFVGANIGYVYGDNVNDTWEAAPETGIKVFVNNSTFVFVQVEYQFFFRSGSNASDSFKNGQFLWTLGLGFRF